MTEAAEPRHITDIMDLMAIVSLVEIRPFEMSAKIIGPAETEPHEPQLTLQYAEILNEREFHTRFRLSVAETSAEYVADIASIHAMSEPVTLERSVANDFAERVGFMSAFPFLRESITTSAARMNRAVPLIGLMRPGDFKIETDDENRPIPSNGDL